MRSKYLKYVQNLSTWHNVLLFGIICLLLFAVILPEADVHLREVSDGSGRINAELFYSPDFVYDSMKAYGEEGRQLYIFMLITAGVIISISVIVFLSILMNLVLAKFQFKNQEKLLYLPLLVLIFDCLENGTLIFLLSQFPLEYPMLSRFLALFTLFKWLCSALVILTITTLTSIFLYQFLKEINWKDIILGKEKQRN